MSRKAVADRFHRVSTSEPVNSTAARVMTPGTSYESSVRVACVHSETPIPTIPVPLGTQDLKAVRFGRFVVVGYAGRQNRKKPAVWVCRCACGRYEHRRVAAIRNTENADDCCSQCRHLVFLKSARNTDRLTPRHGERNFMVACTMCGDKPTIHPSALCFHCKPAERPTK